MKNNNLYKSEIFNTLLRFVFVIIVCIFILVMLVKRFVYFHPMSELLPSKEPYQDIYQGSLDNRLHGRFFQGDPKKPVILMCHGNAGNLSTRSDKITPFTQRGYSVLIFDYSGYGNSTGKMSEQQCYDDASVFVALLRQDRSPSEIVLYGESLGAPVAMYVARRYNIPTVILESSLISVKDIIKDKCAFLSPLSFLFPEFDTRSCIEGFKGRILMLHSMQDEICSYNSTLGLQKSVTKFITIQGGHNNPVIPWNEIEKFIDQA